MYLKNFGINPQIKVKKCKSGTYTYYKVTFKCEDIVFELVLEGIGVLKEAYKDLKYVDSNTTMLIVITQKDGLKVVRKQKV